jgi:hypothetical protein
VTVQIGLLFKERFMSLILNGTNGLSDVDGTAATPAIRGTDANTGMFFPAADTIAFSEGGVESMRIDSAGNVGIGTASPAAKLDVTGEIKIYPSSSSAILRFGSGGVEKGKIAVDSSSNMDFETAGLQRMRIDSSGNVGIGTSSGSKLSILKNSPTGFSEAQIEMLSSAGDVVLSFHAAGATAVCIDHVRGAAGVRCVNLTRTAYAPIEASAFTVPSDYRVKENVTPLTDALNRVAQLSPKRFSYIEGSMSYNNGKFVDGFIAHEAALAVPEAVTGEKDAVGDDGKPIMQGIDQAKLVPLLVAAIQEQQALITQLQVEVDALKEVK